MSIDSAPSGRGTRSGGVGMSAKTPFKSVVLPRNIVDRMTEPDRKEYARHVGCPSAGLTTSELAQKITVQAEKELQNQIRQYLGQKEICFICPPMFRRSQLPE